MPIDRFESGAYSLADVSCSIIGPGIGLYFTGVAEEAYSVDFDGDRDTMTMGADGSGMHSLRVAQNGTITVRLLKTSSQNRQMLNGFKFQTGTSANHGRNIIRLDDPTRNDQVIGYGCAFRRMPTLSWAVVGNIHEWVFNCTRITANLGAGQDFIIGA